MIDLSKSNIVHEANLNQMLKRILREAASPHIVSPLDMEIAETLLMLASSKIFKTIKNTNFAQFLIEFGTKLLFEYQEQEKFDNIQLDSKAKQKPQTQNQNAIPFQPEGDLS